MEKFAGVRTIARIKSSCSVGADDDRDCPLALRRQRVQPTSMALNRPINDRKCVIPMIYFNMRILNGGA
jgi:hypothetical protein